MIEPTGTNDQRPTEPVDGMIRDYITEIDGVKYVILEQRINGSWVEVASTKLELEDE